MASTATTRTNYKKVAKQVAKWSVATVGALTCLGGAYDGYRYSMRNDELNPLEAGKHAFSGTVLFWHGEPTPSIPHYLSNVNNDIALPFATVAGVGGIGGGIIADIHHVCNGLTKSRKTHTAVTTSTTVESAVANQNSSAAADQKLQIVVTDKSPSKKPVSKTRRKPLQVLTQPDYSKAKPYDAPAQASSPALVSTGARANLIATIPTAEEMDKAYPARAANDQVEGTAIVNCAPQRNATLADCEILSESPKDYGFGSAAIKLAENYVTLKPATINTKKPKTVTLKFVLDR